MAESTTKVPSSSRSRQPKSLRAEADFRARVAQLGGIVLEPEWLGAGQPHRAVCSKGHECKPRPNDLRRPGRGMCRTCAGNDPAVTEAAFRARVEQLGGEVLETEWRGILKPHKVRCRYGHIGHPYPARVAEGVGICRTCGGNDPAAAWEAFQARIAELGATLLEPAWLGAHKPHRVLCKEGHQCRPTPTHIASGKGPCHKCKGRIWDVFYVVTSGSVVKIGVTSGDPRPRLQNHARDGLHSVVRLHRGLPGDAARGIERNVLAALRDAREEPLRGREYFSVHVLPLVLDLVDNHPAVRV